MNSKSVQEVSKQDETKFAKTDTRYWPKRLFRNKFTRDGITHETADWCIKLRFKGRRETINLGTPNQASAARDAAKIYKQLLADRDWSGVLDTYKPKAVVPDSMDRSAIIGELLREIRDTRNFRLSTVSVYEQALRLIASQIADIGDQPATDKDGNPIKDKKGKPVLLSRFDYKKGGRAAWTAKVDALSLDVLTPSAIQKWRIAYLERAGNAPDARRRATNSVNSHLRNARSLFSEYALEFVRSKLRLPDPLPFAGVKLERRPTSRYISSIDAKQILTKAREELGNDPERAQQFRIFCLALLCGLRKREIDTLLWRQVDFDSRQIRIEATEFFQPKSEDSLNSVDVDDELVALLRGWKARDKGKFVVHSANPPRYHVSRVNYRCQKDFAALYDWLKSKGVTARKKLHELRKELGAVLASEHGIFAAQQMLRHSDIRTTQQFYTDKKKRISAGFGSLLAGGANVVDFPDPSVEKRPAAQKRA